MAFDHQQIVGLLHKNGIVFSTPPEGGALHDDIIFEPPCSIAATINLSEPFHIGAFTHLNGGYIKNVTIGRYCSFARDVQIGHGQHPTNWLSVSPLQYVPNYRQWSSFGADRWGGASHVEVKNFTWAQHTTIGNDVWIGQGVFIKDGVHIGDGAIIGAHSVVTHDVPPYSIVAGIPARIIRLRFPDDIIKHLSALRWWRYKMEDFNGVDFSHIERAIDQISSLIEAQRIHEYLPSQITTDLLVGSSCA